MEYTQKLVYQSNYWYNDGLKRARIRDMSGAVTSLKKSLQYNRENIAARNLLGLVYYGRGEVGEALVEWILSKNFQSHENIANYYIKKLQENPTELEKVNQAIRKFNQSLSYCFQDGEDLAIIQLKKVVADHPSFLKAYQLLSLLYLHHHLACFDPNGFMYSYRFRRYHVQLSKPRDACYHLLDYHVFTLCHTLFTR